MRAGHFSIRQRIYNHTVASGFDRCKRLALPLALLVPLAAADEGVPLPAAPAIGNEASYDGKLMGIACPRWTTREITGDGVVRTTCEGFTLETARAHDLNPIRMLDSAGKPLVSFTPFAPSLKFPLAVGKRWSGQYVGYTDYNKLMWEGETTCKVEAREAVALAMGTQEAFRIECEQGWKVGPRTGKVHATRWYAPALGTIVKEIHAREPERWNFELTSYGVPPPPAPSPAAKPAPEPATPHPTYDPNAPGILDPDQY